MLKDNYVPFISSKFQFSIMIAVWAQKKWCCWIDFFKRRKFYQVFKKRKWYSSSLLWVWLGEWTSSKVSQPWNPLELLMFNFQKKKKSSKLCLAKKPTKQIIGHMLSYRRLLYSKTVWQTDVPCTSILHFWDLKAQTE